MTYRDISNLLLRLGRNIGKPARTVKSADKKITGLYIDPVAWFIAVADTGELDLGRYRAEDLRLVETQTLPLSQVTPKVIGDKLDLALIEYVARAIGQAVQSRMESCPRQSSQTRLIHRIPVRFEMAG